MISVNELRNGVFFQENGQIWQVLSFEHIKLGRGSATIKVKIKNLRSGTILEKSYINTAKVDEINLRKTEMQFLYEKSGRFYFMDPVNFEQIDTSEKILRQVVKFLKEGLMLNVLFFEDEPLSVVLPLKLVYKIADTSPGVRGNTVSNIFKEAILDNGLKIKVPLFININDNVLVDTRSGTYIERVGA